jgi:hypothetical protein
VDWELGGFAPTFSLPPPVGPNPEVAAMDVSTAQLVQAMASFGGSGAGESLNAGPLSAKTSQQPLLTTPHA